jgi:hypothetical protein
VRRTLLAELPRTVMRLAIAFGLFGLISRVPWPAGTAHWIGLASFGALTAAVLIIGGALLYNTFYPVQTEYRPRHFYPRHRP